MNFRRFQRDRVLALAQAGEFYFRLDAFTIDHSSTPGLCGVKRSNDWVRSQRIAPERAVGATDMRKAFSIWKQPGGWLELNFMWSHAVQQSELFTHKITCRSSGILLIGCTG